MGDLQRRFPQLNWLKTYIIKYDRNVCHLVKFLAEIPEHNPTYAVPVITKSTTGHLTWSK